MRWKAPMPIFFSVSGSVILDRDVQSLQMKSGISVRPVVNWISSSASQDEKAPLPTFFTEAGRETDLSLQASKAYFPIEVRDEGN